MINYSAIQYLYMLHQLFQLYQLVLSMWIVQSPFCWKKHQFITIIGCHMILLLVKSFEKILPEEADIWKRIQKIRSEKYLKKIIMPGRLPIAKESILWTSNDYSNHYQCCTCWWCKSMKLSHHKCLGIQDSECRCHCSWW